MALIFVDVEATGPTPRFGHMTEFACVEHQTGEYFHATGLDEFGPGSVQNDKAAADLAAWLAKFKGRVTLVSDNPAFDFMWMADFCWAYLHECPFGHSGRRISDFYAGCVRDFRKTQNWKSWRKTKHDHNALHDALGNVEAFDEILRRYPKETP